MTNEDFPANKDFPAAAEPRITQCALARPQATDGIRDFVATSSAFRRGTETVDALRSALDTTTVYVVRHATPGIVVHEVPGHEQWLFAFTSLPALARFATQGHAPERGAVSWLSTSGADLISHLPAGVDLLIDPGQEHVVALPPAWLRAEIRRDV